MKYMLYLTTLEDFNVLPNILSTNDVTNQLQYCCDTIISTSKIPKKWRENLLHCHNCNRSLVKYLSHYFMHCMAKKLQHNQTLYLAGGFEDTIQDTCCVACNSNKPQPNPRYSSNAEEADTCM